MSCTARDLQLLNGMLHFTHACAHTHTQSYVARDLLHLCFRDKATLFGTSCFPSPTAERTEGREGKEGKGSGVPWALIFITPWRFPQGWPPDSCLAKPQDTN